jgi:hypothetical protein
VNIVAVHGHKASQSESRDIYSIKTNTIHNMHKDYGLNAKLEFPRMRSVVKTAKQFKCSDIWI